MKFAEHPDLLVLLFPYLYTNGRGYYSLCRQPSENNPAVSEEEEGGYAIMNGQDSFTKYAKHRLLLADRRFGHSPKFLLFAMDMIKKLNIYSSSRHVVPLKERECPLRRDEALRDDEVYNHSRVSLVLHTVRSSYAYKRVHNPDLQVMFDALGPPQLFITLTCNDFASGYETLLEGKQPWVDPILFALHYKRISQEATNKYIKKGVNPY